MVRVSVVANRRYPVLLLNLFSSFIRNASSVDTLTPVRSEVPWVIWVVRGVVLLASGPGFPHRGAWNGSSIDPLFRRVLGSFLNGSDYHVEFSNLNRNSYVPEVSHLTTLEVVSGFAQHVVECYLLPLFLFVR